MVKESLNIAIAGATGYVGLELVKILSKHPNAKISYLLAQKSIGKSINSFDLKIKKKSLPKISKIEKVDWNKVNILFAALPNGEAQKICKKLPKSVKLIDLSADFRLRNPNDYKKWYGVNHNCKDQIKNSIYAISEFSKKDIKRYNIISCPGCYPTSILLPLIPLIKNNMINQKNIIVDSKSGYSGAGKNIKKKFKKTNIIESVSAYGVGNHRHMSEIDQELTCAAKKKIKITFTPHLLPMFRGILSTIYIEPKLKFNAKKIYNLLKKVHKNNFFINIAKFNTSIGTTNVLDTNFCRISVCEDRKKNRVIIISTIDNLLKGAAGQAVQNMNLSNSLDEKIGLR